MKCPTIFLPHGGGPWPFVESLGAFHPPELRHYLEGLGGVSGVRAVLMVSAHWEEALPTVQSGQQPPLLFDYSGFPPHTYELTWPAPGMPSLAARVQALLGAAGFKTNEDAARGFDHGAFVPGMLAWPEATVAMVQLSLKKGLDPAVHLAMGKALAPLRGEGILIVGSGMSYHNMRQFRTPTGRADALRFDAWLQQTVQLPEAQRNQQLTQWEKAPRARECHPREEHLLPLMVAAGAGGRDRGQVPYSGEVLGTRVSAIHFG